MRRRTERNLSIALIRVTKKARRTRNPDLARRAGRDFGAARRDLVAPAPISHTVYVERALLGPAPIFHPVYFQLSVAVTAHCPAACSAAAMSSQSASSTSISPSDGTNGSAPDVTAHATDQQLAATVNAAPISATAPPNPDASALNGDIMPGEASKGTASTTAPGPDDEHEEQDDCPDPNIDPQLYAEDRRMRAEGASRKVRLDWKKFPGPTQILEANRARVQAAKEGGQPVGPIIEEISKDIYAKYGAELKAKKQQSAADITNVSDP